MENSERKAAVLAVQKAEQQLDQLFFNVFQGHPDGVKIFTDLSHLFYDRTSVMGFPVDVNATLVREGERNVVLYIMSRISRFQENKK
jgi:hypothetical protein